MIKMFLNYLFTTLQRILLPTVSLELFEDFINIGLTIALVAIYGRIFKTEAFFLKDLLKTKCTPSFFRIITTVEMLIFALGLVLAILEIKKRYTKGIQIYNAFIFIIVLFGILLTGTQVFYFLSVRVIKDESVNQLLLISSFFCITLLRGITETFNSFFIGRIFTIRIEPLTNIEAEKQKLNPLILRTQGLSVAMTFTQIAQISFFKSLSFFKIPVFITQNPLCYDSTLDATSRNTWIMKTITGIGGLYLFLAIAGFLVFRKIKDLELSKTQSSGGAIDNVKMVGKILTVSFTKWFSLKTILTVKATAVSLLLINVLFKLCSTFCNSLKLHSIIHKTDSLTSNSLPTTGIENTTLMLNDWTNIYFFLFILSGLLQIFTFTVQAIEKRVFNRTTTRSIAIDLILGGYFIGIPVLFMSLNLDLLTPLLTDTIYNTAYLAIKLTYAKEFLKCSLDYQIRDFLEVAQSFFEFVIFESLLKSCNFSQTQLKHLVLTSSMALLLITPIYLIQITDHYFHEKAPLKLTELFDENDVEFDKKINTKN